MKTLILMMTLMTLTSCQESKTADKNELGSDVVSKNYFVKGMTCGGCIIGVKSALNKSVGLNIFAKDIEVGKATLQFKKKNYKKSLTDCAVTKSIEKVTEFKVFLDSGLTKRACGS